MASVATRLLSLILLLQSRASWKSAELAAELNVSERTIFRYMGMLDEIGIPLYSERGPYGGFSLVRGYRLPPLIFSAEEATVLYMGAHLVREVWGQTYEDAVTSVTAKLDNVLPDDLREEVADARQSLVILGGLTRRDYRPWEPMIHTLRQCIANRRCVRLQYRGATRQEETERIVEPYAMMLRWGLWYLVGFCRLRQDLRTFRLDRIQEATALEERCATPRDFSAREYLERTLTAAAEPVHQVVVHLEASAAAVTRDRHGTWMQLEDHPDGSITARFSVPELDWAAGWVLSHGGAARAVQPPELIARVRQTARAALRQYSGETAAGRPG